MSSVINDVAHGFVAGDIIYFGNVVPADAGVDETIPYYVLAAGLTANAFEFSTAPGGAPVALVHDITSAVVTGPSTYVAVTDPTDVHAPPVVPSAPAGLALSSVATLDADGKPIIRLDASITAVTSATARDTIVTVVDASGKPLTIIIPTGQTLASINGVLGLTDYTATAVTYDVFGNGSTPSDPVVHTTVRDTVAPAQPQGVVLTPGALGFLASWGSSGALDLSFYEFRYALDDGSGTGPDIDLWVTARTKSTLVWIGGVVTDLNEDGTADARYWFQVRAIDTSGNVVTSGSDSTPVGYTDDDDAGFTAAVSVNPLLTDSQDIALGAIGTSHISIAGLDAGVLRAGYLRVNTSDTTAIDGIQVFNGATLIGFWNETGLYIYDSTDPTDYIRIFAGGLSVFLNGAEVAAISPAGVNASALTSGALPGGGNIVKNSSFELADFTVPTTVTATWDVAADWAASRVGADTNVTTNAGNLTQTASTY